MAGASLSSLHLKLRRSSRIVSVAGPAANTQTSTRVQLPQKIRDSRVLVLGGTGRVGGSTAIALSNLCPDLQIIVAGRNSMIGADMLTTLGGNSEFCEVDINSEKSLEAALEDADLVVHALGVLANSNRQRSAPYWKLP